MTQYQPSIITGYPVHQQLAVGYPIGKRFRSAIVTRVADACIMHLGHHHQADGRWRIYVFADAAGHGDVAELGRFSDWLANSAQSPVVACTPEGADIDSVFDVKIVFPQPYTETDLNAIPAIFLPRVGPFQLIDYEKVYAVAANSDIFDERGIDRQGAVVIVRPDQYVANIFPLTATEELAKFFAAFMTPARGRRSSLPT
jgi:phenol 2-monooxygenase